MTTQTVSSDPSIRRHRPRPSLLAAACCVLLGGCRTYEPRPLDVAEIDRLFQTRVATTDDAPGQDRVELDLASAEATAILCNADLRRRRADVGVAEATALHAGLWPDPAVGLEFTRLLQAATSPNELFGTVGFTLPVSGRLEIEKRRLGRAHTAALVELEVAEWRIRVAVRDAWRRWSAIVAELDATTRLVGSIDDLLGIVDALEDAGEFSRVEARLFRLARLQAEIERTNLVARCDATRIELLGLLGLPPGFAPELRPLPIALDAEIDGTPATAPGTDAAPAVRIALAQYEVAETVLEQAIREQYPDLGVTPGYGTRDGVRQFSLGFSIPLPIWNGNRQAIEAAIAARTAAEVEVQRAVERTASAIAAARVVRDQAAHRAGIVERDLVPLVAAQTEETRTLARLGQVDTLILLDALNQQRQAALQRIAAWRDLGLAENAVAALTGPPPVESDVADRSITTDSEETP